MTVAHVEVIVEEPSAEVALREILPRILGATDFRIHAHACKDELLQRLPARLHGYAAWRPENKRVVVVVDRDDDDCRALKRRMDAMVTQAGLPVRSAGRGRIAVVNRIVIEELEAWFFGDWDAVRAAYPRVNPTIPKQAKYRQPDEIRGGTWEALERILKKAGYFPTGLRKVEAARSIAAQMDPERNTSPSFRAFRDALLDWRSA